MGDTSPQDPDHEPSKPAAQTGLGNFWTELKRRKVVRVAITYGIVAWLIMQVAGLTFEGFGVPVWAFRFVVIMLWLFFPVVLIITWAFELTPDGIKTTKHAREVRGGAPVSADQQRKRNRYSVLFAAVIPTLIFGTLAVVFYFQKKPVTPTESDKSIAVLPFTNMSPDAENAYFADGLHETILTTLANLGDLRVISRTSVMPYRDSEKPIPVIGEELKVAYILEGSVQKIGNDFRLTTQLINASDDHHLWAKNYDGEFRDVFTVQSQLAREVSQSLKAILSPEEEARLDKKPTENLEAYNLYLKAIALGNRKPQKPILLEQAVALDPDFASAWANLSMTYIVRFRLGDDRRESTLRKAKDAMSTALRLEPNDPEVIFATGYYFANARQYAIANFFNQIVMDQVPNDADKILHFGNTLNQQGEWKRGMQFLEKAYRLEPKRVRYFLTNSYNYLHDWGKAQKFMLEGIAPETAGYLVRQLVGELLIEGRVPEYEKLDTLSDRDKVFLAWVFGDAKKILQYASAEGEKSDEERSSRIFLLDRSPSWCYAIANRITGNAEEANRSLLAARDRLLEKYENTYEDFLTLEELGLVYALLGEEKASRESFEQALAFLNKEDKSNREDIQAYIDRAIALAWLGQTDEAVAELARLIKMPSPLNPHHMRHCLDFWPLRDHPGFQAILDDPANLQPLDLDKL